MRKIFSIVLVMLCTASFAQFNPSQHTPSNKPYAPNGKPTDARSYYYDASTFSYRPFTSRAEILSYLSTSLSRSGNFPIFMDSAGQRYEYWFKNGVTDNDLTLKASSVSATAPLGKSGDNLTLNYDQGGLKVNDGNALEAKAKVFGSFGHLRGLAVADTMATYAVYENKTFHYFKYDPDDASSTDDSAAVIVAGSKRFKRVFNGVYRPEDFGAKGNGIDDDSWAWQKLMNYIGSGGGSIEADGKKTYKFLSVVDLPVNSSLHTPIVLKLNGAKLVGDRIFRRRPADQSVAVAQTNTRIIIEDGKFLSLGGANSLAVEIGSTYGSFVSKSVFYNYDSALAFKFGLNSTSYQNIYSFCKNGLIFRNGDWSGVNLSNAQSNSSFSVQDRFYNPSGAEKSISVLGASGINIISPIIEGNSPQYGIYFNALGSTVVPNFKVLDAHIEVATGRAGIYLEPNGGIFTIDGVFQQYADTLIAVNRAGGNPIISISNIPNVALSKFTNNSTQAFWEFSRMPISFTYDGNFVVSGSYIKPTTIGYLDYAGLLRGTAPGIYSTGNLLIQGTTIRMLGNTTPLNDNQYLWGTSSARPSATYTRALHLFENSSLLWSNSSGTADVSINRTDSFVLRINTTGNLVWPRGTTAQRRAYQVTNTLGSSRYNTETNKFEGLWGSTYRNFASEDYVLDSAQQLRNSIKQIQDSLLQHNLRLIIQRDSIAQHNLRLLKINDSLAQHNSRLLALENTTGGGGTSSETFVEPNDADYTIATATGNIAVNYYNDLTADRTITMPDPATNTGRKFTIRNGSASFNLILSIPIYENSSSSYSSIGPGQSITFYSNATLLKRLY